MQAGHCFQTGQQQNYFEFTKIKSFWIVIKYNVEENDVELKEFLYMTYSHYSCLSYTEKYKKLIKLHKKALNTKPSV